MTILVVGADTVAGANVAARFARDHHVATLSLGKAVSIPDCTPVAGPVDRPERVLEALGLPPQWIVLCGPAAVSSWERSRGIEAEFARRWTAAADGLGCDLTYLSTDAVFDGPRLFHDETSPTAATPAARAALLAEEAVLAEHGGALVVRTHVFGWSPTGDGPVETLLAALAGGRGIDADRGHHATPIHAGHLADILLIAREAELTGIWHAGGGERIDPRGFSQRLALHFEHPWAATASTTTSPTPRETSLHSLALARRLDVAPTMIDEGLERLLLEREDGFVDRLLHAEIPAEVGLVA